MKYNSIGLGREDYPDISAYEAIANQAQFDGVEGLTIYNGGNKKKVDLSFLVYFQWIKSLIILSTETNIKNKEVYKHITNLEMLQVSVENKIDFSFLKEFKNLKWLSLAGQKIEVVNHLKTLERLWIDKNNCSVVDFENLKELRDLAIYTSNHLKGDELMPLRKLNNLTIEWDKSVEDLTFLAHNEGINRIKFERASKLTSFPNMSKCTEIKKIYIRMCNRFKGFEGLRNIPNLTHFALLNRC
jgi:hypothetical protein